MSSNKPIIVVASANGSIGIEAAVDILRGGGSSLDAVEAATQLVEINTDDRSVGVGGYPNAAGDVELDASIMDGSSRDAGAVAALKGFPHPISVARTIMERLPHHLLLAGQGAAEFARECGFSAADLLTDEARQALQDRIQSAAQTGGLLPQAPRSVGNTASSSPRDEERDIVAIASSLADAQNTAGTVNFIAIDSEGHFASAVSTSGWAFKYPGRVGDSPIIGAGNYCDDRYGACTCTGLGEWALRASTARAVVLRMELGHALGQSCEEALRDLFSIELPPSIEQVMNLIALDRQGNHAAYSTHPDRTYIWQTPEMSSFETTARTWIEPGAKAQGHT